MCNKHEIWSFIELILREIIKIVATICQILRLKCTKFDFGWCSATDPTGGAYSAPPDLLAEFKGASNVPRLTRKLRVRRGWMGGSLSSVKRSNFKF